MASISLSQYTSLYQYVYATVSWDESPTVTVVITGNEAGLSWRIRGRGSDSTVYLSDASGAVGVERTFEAPDGVRDFAFQVYSTIGGNDQNGSYTNGALFTVNFSDDEDDSGDDDDDSGGSGSSSSGTGANILHINQGEGTIVTVERTWSDIGDYTHDGEQVFLTDGDIVYYDADRLVITATAQDGYQLDYYDFNGSQVPFQLSNFSNSSSGKYKLTYNRDATITTTATRIDSSGEDEGGDSGSGDDTSGSIVIDGVTLPEIPADALSTYPYAVIVKCEGAESTTNFAGVLILAEREFIYVDDPAIASNIVEDYSELVISPGAGRAYICGYLGDEVSIGFDAWTLSTANDYEAGEPLFPVGVAESDGSTATLVYANHDIYHAEDYDRNAGTYTKGELYFASSTGEPDDGGDSGDSSDPTDPEETSDYYLFERSTIEGLADEARRLGGVTGELTTARMKEIFAGVEVGGSGESTGMSLTGVAVGIIPEYQRCNADSTLDLSTIDIAVSAVG